MLHTPWVRWISIAVLVCGMVAVCQFIPPVDEGKGPLVYGIRGIMLEKLSE